MMPTLAGRVYPRSFSMQGYGEPVQRLIAISRPERAHLRERSVDLAQGGRVAQVRVHATVTVRTQYERPQYAPLWRASKVPQIDNFIDDTADYLLPALGAARSLAPFISSIHQLQSPTTEIQNPQNH